MKTLLFLSLLWGVTGCVTVAPMPMETTDAPATYETSRLHRHWMERESREKPRRKEHVSDRGSRTSACEPASVRSGHRGFSQKGQQSKRS